MLQTLACAAGTEGQRGVVSRGLGFIEHPQCSPSRAHLDELVLGAELGYNDVLAIRDTGQGDAQAPTGTLVAVSRQGLHQAATDSLYQVEGGVQWTQEPLPGFLRHLDDVGTCLAWVSRAKGQGSGATGASPPGYAPPWGHGISMHPGEFPVSSTGPGPQPGLLLAAPGETEAGHHPGRADSRSQGLPSARCFPTSWPDP